MDTKKRTDSYHSVGDTSRSPVRVGPVPEGNLNPVESEIVVVNPTTTVLRSDVSKMMRKHVLDGLINLITAGVPYLD